MKFALDTSVLVPALLAGHPFHPIARPWLAAATQRRIAAHVALHAAAETWSVLTRVALPERVPPAVARSVLARVLDAVECGAPDRMIYDRAVELCIEAGLRSGAIFDALHLASAEAAHCDVMLTLNPRDFDRFVQTSVTIRSPSDLRPE